MELLRSNFKTLALSAGVILTLGFFNARLFDPMITNARINFQNQNERFEEVRNLDLKKEEYAREYESKKKLLKTNDGLNEWMSRLSAFAQSKNFSFKSLEPKGAESLNLAFAGDSIAAGKIIYWLIENEPLSRVDSISFKNQPEGWECQMTLSRA